MFVNVLLFFDVGRRVQSQGLIQFRLQRRPSIHLISHASPPVPTLRDQEEKPSPPRPRTTTQSPVFMSRIRTEPALFGAVQGLKLGQGHLCGEDGRRKRLCWGRLLTDKQDVCKEDAKKR